VTHRAVTGQERYSCFQLWSRRPATAESLYPNLHLPTAGDESSRRLTSIGTSLGTLPNALVVLTVGAVMTGRRLSRSEPENSDTNVWRGPVLLIDVGVCLLYDRQVHRDVTDLVGLIAEPPS